MLNYPQACVLTSSILESLSTADSGLGEYFFDIHPPLGKLILTVVAKAGGYNGTQAWATIGEPIHPSINLLALVPAPPSRAPSYRRYYTLPDALSASHARPHSLRPPAPSLTRAYSSSSALSSPTRL